MQYLYHVLSLREPVFIRPAKLGGIQQVFFINRFVATPITPKNILLFASAAKDILEYDKLRMRVTAQAIRNIFQPAFHGVVAPQLKKAMTFPCDNAEWFHWQTTEKNNPELTKTKPLRVPLRTFSHPKS
jgi:hypothetical protein